MQEKWGKCYLNTSKFCGDRRHFKEFYFPAAQTIHLLQSDELGVSKVTLPTCRQRRRKERLRPSCCPGSGLFAAFPFLTAPGHTLRPQLLSLCALWGICPLPPPPTPHRQGGWLGASPCTSAGGQGCEQTQEAAADSAQPERVPFEGHTHRHFLVLGGVTRGCGARVCIFCG